MFSATPTRQYRRLAADHPGKIHELGAIACIDRRQLHFLITFDEPLRRPLKRDAQPCRLERHDLDRGIFAAHDELAALLALDFGEQAADGCNRAVVFEHGKLVVEELVSIR